MGAMSPFVAVWFFHCMPMPLPCLLLTVVLLVAAAGLFDSEALDPAE